MVNERGIGNGMVWRGMTGRCGGGGNGKVRGRSGGDGRRGWAGMRGERA